MFAAVGGCFLGMPPKAWLFGSLLSIPSYISLEYSLHVPYGYSILSWQSLKHVMPTLVVPYMATFAFFVDWSRVRQLLQSLLDQVISMCEADADGPKGHEKSESMVVPHALAQLVVRAITQLGLRDAVLALHGHAFLSSPMFIASVGSLVVLLAACVYFISALMSGACGPGLGL